jgi:hypothetical protein
MNEYKMRYMITIMVLLALGSPGAAKCCSLGGGASYNFLGDPAVDINMDSYDQFARENAPAGLAATADVKTAATSRLRLNLDDNSSISLLLSLADGSYLGRGNMTASGGQLYRFGLAAEGSSVLGEYSKSGPDGKRLTGTAAGRWEI